MKNKAVIGFHFKAQCKNDHKFQKQGAARAF